MPDPQLPATTNWDISAWCEPKPDPPKPTQFWNWRPGWKTGGTLTPRLRFTESRDACAEFERLLGTHWRRYTEELWVLLSMDDGYSKRWQEQAETDAKVDAQHFAFITATPEQRCAALLKVIKG